MRVDYLPFIRAPPTEILVIYAAINRLLDIMNQLIYHKVFNAMFRMKKGRNCNIL